jgi:hypothetical protein
LKLFILRKIKPPKLWQQEFKKIENCMTRLIKNSRRPPND